MIRYVFFSSVTMSEYLGCLQWDPSTIGPHPVGYRVDQTLADEIGTSYSAALYHIIRTSANEEGTDVYDAPAEILKRLKEDYPNAVVLEQPDD